MEIEHEQQNRMKKKNATIYSSMSFENTSQTTIFILSQGKIPRYNYKVRIGIPKLNRKINKL